MPGRLPPAAINGCKHPCVSARQSNAAWRLAPKRNGLVQSRERQETVGLDDRATMRVGARRPPYRLNESMRATSPARTRNAARKPQASEALIDLTSSR